MVWWVICQTAAACAHTHMDGLRGNQAVASQWPLTKGPLKITRQALTVAVQEKVSLCYCRQLLSTTPFKHQILSAVPNWFCTGSLHFEWDDYWILVSENWHPILASKPTICFDTAYHNNKVCNRICHFKMNMVSFQTSVQMIFTSVELPSGYSWVFYGLIKAWNLLESMLMRLHRKLAWVQCTLYLYHNVYYFNIGQTVESHPWDMYGTNHFQVLLRTCIAINCRILSLHYMKNFGYQILNSWLSPPLHWMMELLPWHCSP